MHRTERLEHGRVAAAPAPEAVIVPDEEFAHVVPIAEDLHDECLGGERGERGRERQTDDAVDGRRDRRERFELLDAWREQRRCVGRTERFERVRGEGDEHAAQRPRTGARVELA